MFNEKVELKQKTTSFQKMLLFFFTISAIGVRRVFSGGDEAVF